MTDEVDFDISFADETVAEADGKFDRLDHIMKSEFPHPETWMTRSVVSVDSVYGLAIFKIHFHSDKNVIIKDYQSSGGNAIYNLDIQVLSEWAQSNGWNRPQPARELVKTDLDFWKHYWSTFTLDSPYLDEVFGKRPEIDPNSHIPDSEK